jgi:hypothetical protein
MFGIENFTQARRAYLLERREVLSSLVTHAQRDTAHLLIRYRALGLTPAQTPGLRRALGALRSAKRTLGVVELELAAS